MNSAAGSTNRLISQGHATRSTLAFSRVIHFITLSIVYWCDGVSIGLHGPDRMLLSSWIVHQHHSPTAVRQEPIDGVLRSVDADGMRAELRWNRLEMDV